MAIVKVVIDSGAELAAATARELDISIVSLRVHLGDETLLDRVELTPQKLFRRLSTGNEKLSIAPPTPETYQRLFSKLGKEADAIISIHASSRLVGSYRAALAAKRAFSGKSEIVVIDSRSLSMAEGFLAIGAAKAAKEGLPPGEIAWMTRGMALQTHLFSLVDDFDRLKAAVKGPIVTMLSSGEQASSWLVSLEDGALTVTEGVPSREKGMERLFEFVELFPHIEELAILYSTNRSEVELLLGKIELLFSRERVILAECGSLLTSLIGLGALCVAVYEGPPGKGSL